MVILFCLINLCLWLSPLLLLLTQFIIKFHISMYSINYMSWFCFRVPFLFLYLFVPFYFEHFLTSQNLKVCRGSWFLLSLSFFPYLLRNWPLWYGLFYLSVWSWLNLRGLLMEVCDLCVYLLDERRGKKQRSLFSFTKSFQTLCEVSSSGCSFWWSVPTLQCNCGWVLTNLQG